MTISSQQGRQPYAGAGTTGPFAVPFKIFAATDLRVVKQSSAGVDTTLVLNVDYTISGTLGVDNGCSVTTTANVAIGETLNLILDPPLTQATDYVSNDAFPAKSHERALDRLTQQNIRTRDLVDRTLRQPDGDYAQLLPLPGRAARAGKFAGFDAAGDPVALSGTGNDSALRTDLAVTTSGADGALLVGFRLPAAGSVARSVALILRNLVDVTSFGAVLDGVTSDHAAFAAADAYAAAGGRAIFIPRSANGMATSQALTVDHRSDLIFEPGAYIKYTGSSNIVILDIGSTNPANVCFSRRYETLWVTRTNQSDWTSEDSVGIRLRNMAGCYVGITECSRHTLGVQTLPAGGAGFQKNRIVLGQLFNNKIDVDVSNATAGFSNDNIFDGGRFSVFSAINSSTARYGVRITSSDGTYTNNNANRFYGQLFELNALDASAEAVCVLMEHGANNRFYDVRDEGNDDPFAREDNDSAENHYDVIYSDYARMPIIESNGNFAAYTLGSARLKFLDGPRLIFASGPMHKRACFYDGGTTVHVPDVSIADAADAVVRTNMSSITINAAYLDTTRGFAAFVNTTDCKQFFLTRDCEAGRGGRVVINCYDAGGSLITTAGSVKGTPPIPFGSTANYGGAFTTGSDSNADVFFAVTAAVKSIRVAVANGDASLRIRSFAIHSVNHHNHCDTWPGYEEIAPGQNIGTAAPTAGTWARGRMVWNATPSAAGTPGWVCTTAGSPGTWKAMANLAA